MTEMAKDKQHTDKHTESGPELAENEPKAPDDPQAGTGETWEATATGERFESTDNQLAEMEVALRESRDKHLRLLAEFDNYKKRTMRERLDLISSASKDLMQSLLPVLDDFDRAKQSADREGSGEQFSEGVSLVYNQLYNILQQKGLKAIESTVSRLIRTGMKRSRKFRRPKKT